MHLTTNVTSRSRRHRNDVSIFNEVSTRSKIGHSKDFLRPIDGVYPQAVQCPIVDKSLTSNLWTSPSDIACRHCIHQFTGPSLSMPVASPNQIYNHDTTFGTCNNESPPPPRLTKQVKEIFCSFSCMLGYLREHQQCTTNNDISRVVDMAINIYGMSVESLHYAPPQGALEILGGPFSIETFHRLTTWHNVKRMTNTNVTFEMQEACYSIEKMAQPMNDIYKSIHVPSDATGNIDNLNGCEEGEALECEDDSLGSNKTAAESSITPSVHTTPARQWSVKNLRVIPSDCMRGMASVQRNPKMGLYTQYIKSKSLECTVLSSNTNVHERSPHIHKATSDCNTSIEEHKTGNGNENNDSVEDENILTSINAMNINTNTITPPISSISFQSSNVTPNHTPTTNRKRQCGNDDSCTQLASSKKVRVTSNNINIVDKNNNNSNNPDEREEMSVHDTPNDSGRVQHAFDNQGKWLDTTFEYK